MSTMPAQRPTPPMAAPAAMGRQIDPLRLLRKHWLALAIALGVGSVLGVVTHVVWGRLYPLYSASVMFQYEPPREALVGGSLSHSEDEMERHMSTERARLKSDRLIGATLRHPRLPALAPKLHRLYQKGGTFNVNECVKDLRNEMSVRIESGTSYITASWMWTDPSEVAAVLGLLRETYMSDVEAENNQRASQDTRLLEQELTNLRAQLGAKSRDIANLVDRADSSVVAEARVNEQGEKLSTIRRSIVAVVETLEAAQVQLADFERHRALGTFPDAVVTAVEQDFQVARLQQQVNELLALESARREALLPGHRDLRALRWQIEGTRKQLEEVRTRLYNDRLATAVESAATGVQQLTAQRVKLEEQEKEVEAKLRDLQLIAQRVAEIKQEQERLQETIAKKEEEFSTFRTKSLSSIAATRVSVAASERKPTDVTLPKIEFVVPGVAILCMGLTGAVLFLREALDQRIHGASDVRAIPRMRVLGLVPHKDEDPVGAKKPEVAYLEEPDGVLAESFRQVRSAVMNRINDGVRRAILVVPTSPQAGGTTVALNLACAIASTGKRVLLVDANVRRPALHSALDLRRGPGLTEVLSRSASLEDAVTRVPALSSLHVLTAGAANDRAMDLLSTQEVDHLLGEARAAYDMVLLDVPPPTISGDASGLADRCDAMLFVVRAASDKRGLLQRLGAEFADKRATLLGVVVNHVRAEVGGYMRQNIRQTHRYRDAS